MMMCREYLRSGIEEIGNDGIGICPFCSFVLPARWSPVTSPPMLGFLALEKMEMEMEMQRRLRFLKEKGGDRRG